MRKPITVTAVAMLLSACGGGSAKPTCNNTCPSQGATQCSGLQVETCTADTNGCLNWSGAVSCGVQRYCSASSSACVSCNSTCPLQGSAQCSGLQIQTCTADANGCLMWSAAAPCPGNLTCDAAQKSCVDHFVTLSWAPNRESGVNGAGGGYQVSISGQPTIDVPYVSGTGAPTSVTTRLPPGTYTASVRAYAALDAQGGTTRALSAPSQSLIVTVP